MNNNKKNMAGILIMLTAIMLTVFLSACEEELSPGETTDSFLKAVKAGDTDTIEELSMDEAFVIGEFFDELSSGDEALVMLDDESREKYKKELLDFDYDIGTEKIDGKKATVSVKFKAYAFGEGVSKWFTEYLEWSSGKEFTESSIPEVREKATSLFNEYVGDLEKNYVKKATVNLVKDAGKWRIASLEENGDMVDGMSGGMYSVLTTYMESMNTDAAE